MSAHIAGHGARRRGRYIAPPNRPAQTLALHRYPPLPATAAHVANDQHQQQHERTHTMLDRSQIDATIYRVAVAGFTYYPDKPIAEPGYTVDEDIDWCMRPLRHLPQEDRTDLRRRIVELITDPSVDRQAFIRHLKSFAADT
jgi:hypothetical protein